VVRPGSRTQHTNRSLTALTHYQKNGGFTLQIRACLGISGMKGNEGHWGGGISIISQNFSKSPSILFHPLESSISQTSPYSFRS
jgi:hypothetical protein